MNDEHNIKGMQDEGIQILNINVNKRGDYYKKQLERLFPDKCKYEV